MRKRTKHPRKKSHRTAHFKGNPIDATFVNSVGGNKKLKRAKIGAYSSMFVMHPEPTSASDIYRELASNKMKKLKKFWK